MSEKVYPRKLITLQSTGVVRLVIEVDDYSAESETEEVRRDHFDYYYGEHTCPSNWFNSIVRMVGPNGDPDPHGLFQVIHVEDAFDIEKEEQENYMLWLPIEDGRLHTKPGVRQYEHSCQDGEGVGQRCPACEVKEH